MDTLGEFGGGGPGMKTRNGAGGRLWAKVVRFFPERQIYHRSQGKVSYMTVSTEVQIAAVGAALLLGVWLAVASASFALRGRAIDIRTADSQSRLVRYERLLQEARSREASALALLRSRTEEFQTIAVDFEQRHEALKALLGPAADVLGAPAQAVAALEAAPGGESRLAGVVPGAALRGDSIGQPPALRVAELRAEQERMMTVAAETAETRIAAAREAIEVAGLKPEDLLGSASAGMGGPLVELDLTQIAPDLADDEAFTARLEEVAAHLAQAEELERAIASAPFRAPLSVDYRLTSRFGSRADPMTHASAYHTGLDLSAYHRAPVVSTANGVISFAGWKGGYGRTIEIDHGNGFKTRYGHLSQIDVEVGDTIVAGDKIGSMGSTGRSTGTHLHYEVWFRGKVQDPAKFLRAGRYVQQS